MLKKIRSNNKPRKVSIKPNKTTVIIIDSCFFTRISCEEMVSCIVDKMSVFSFECFTDYKLWSEANLAISQKRNVIFNAASGLFYEKDAIDFLTYEKAREDVSGEIANILFLASKSRPQLYYNAIITYYMIKFFPTSSTRVINDFLEMNLCDIKETIQQFILDSKVTKVSVSDNADKHPHRFTTKDLRTIKIILSGTEIKKASSHYVVNTKTLYTQRTNLLNKLAI